MGQKTLAWANWLVIGLTTILYVVLFTLFFNSTTPFPKVVSNFVEAAGGGGGGETSDMGKLRKAKWDTIRENGTELDAGEVADIKKSVDTFMASGETYRIKGHIYYGYYWNASVIQEVKVDFTVSYNAKLNVYKYVLKAKHESGSSTYDDEKIGKYYKHDGTFYIVVEDGRTYLLSEERGEKKATDITDGNLGEYAFLNLYRLENIINTGLLVDKGTENYAYLYCDDSYCFQYHKTDVDKSLYPYGKNQELKVVGDRPVRYKCNDLVPGSDVYYSATFNIYYGGVQQFRPKVKNYSQGVAS